MGASWYLPNSVIQINFYIGLLNLVIAYIISLATTNQAYRSCKFVCITISTRFALDNVLVLEALKCFIQSVC